MRHAALERSADASRRAVELADQLYRSGVSDFLRVLDAERALYTAEDQLAESERLLCTDLIAVYKALGGGWEPFAPERA
ncbi:MAG: TolC family protein [Planctomycetota bacterium]